MKHIGGEMKCFGSTIVGARGQAVIPASARKELSIESGDTLLVFKAPMAKGLVMVKAEMIEEILSDMSEHIASFEKMVREHKPKSTKTRREV